MEPEHNETILVKPGVTLDMAQPQSDANFRSSEVKIKIPWFFDREWGGGSGPEVIKVFPAQLI